jgi:hypothetical protein
MATTLSTAVKKSIRDKLKTKIKTAGYKKGHVAQTKGNKISAVKTKPKTSTGAEKLDPKDKNYAKKVAARKYAKAHKKAMHTKKAKGDEKGRTVAQKTYAQGAKAGAKMSHRKKVHDPKGGHKAWRKKHMDAAKKLTGEAKKKQMRKVANTYRKKIGLKAKKYT